MKARTMILHGVAPHFNGDGRSERQSAESHESLAYSPVTSPRVVVVRAVRSAHTLRHTRTLNQFETNSIRHRGGRHRRD